MNNFEDWYKNNETKAALATRRELAEMAFTGGVESTLPPQKLEFRGRELTAYELKTELTLDSEAGFNLDLSDYQGGDSEELTNTLQLLLNEDGGIDILPWIAASQSKPCIIEFSKGDVIDYSALANQEGASCQCGRSFLAFVKASNHFIEIIEVVEK